MRVLSRIYGASVQCTSVSSSYRVASLWHSSSRPLACSGSCAIQLWEAQHKKLEQQEQANPANGITISGPHTTTRLPAPESHYIQNDSGGCRGSSGPAGSQAQRRWPATMHGSAQYETPKKV